MEFGKYDLDETLVLGSIYNLITTEEYNGIEIIVRFFNAGLKSNEKCIYISDALDIDELLGVFDSIGSNAAAYIASGQLKIMSPSKLNIEKYTFFKAENIVSYIDSASSEGYSGLRVAGDFFANIDITEDVLERFEADLKSAFIEYPMAVVNTYNVDRSGAQKLLTVVGKNPNFIYKINGRIHIHHRSHTADYKHMHDMIKELVEGLLIDRQNIKMQNAIYELISDLASEVAYRDNAVEMFTVMLKRIMDTLMADTGIMKLYKNSSLGVVEDVFIKEGANELFEGGSTETLNTILGRVMAMLHETGCYCTDESAPVPDFIKSARDKMKIKSTIIIPLILDQKLVGCLGIGSVNSSVSYRSQERFLLESCTKAVSIIKNHVKFKNMQSEIRQAEKMEALGVLTSGVAHEFNNLLTPILGFAQIIKNKTDDPNLKRYVEIIENSAKDGAMVVKRVQEFTRREDSSTRVRLDINEVISNTVLMLEPKWKSESEAMKKKIIINQKLDAAGYILACPTEIREVLVNLIINAVHAVKNDGHIKIESFNDENYICFAVEDDGMGMTEEVRQNIFTPFFTTKNQRGTGLGLSIVQSIVTSHGGSIGVSSREGQGTRFVVRIPIYSYEGLGEDECSEGWKISGRALVVDDQKTVGDTIVHMLTEMGLAADLVSSGSEAVEKHQKEKYDFIICDLAMPEMTGVEVAKRIREFDHRASFILMTGWAGWITDCDREYIDMIVEKPFTLCTIYDLLVKTMEKRYRV